MSEAYETHPDEARLNDLVDGLLTAEDARSLEAHFEGCEACRRRVDALRALTADLAGLPKALSPRRDLRQGVRERVRGGSAGGRLPAVLRAAAAVLLAVGAGAGVWFGLLAPEPPAPGPDAPAVAADDVIVAPYAAAADELAAELEARREALAPYAGRALEASLRSVDRAIRELERARAREGADEELTRRLSAAHRTRLELLRTAAGMLPASGMLPADGLLPADGAGGET